jgi:hypothetical protein
MTDQHKWEYRVASFGTYWTGPKDEDLEATLNGWGVEGWEVVAVTKIEKSNRVRVLAKRMLSSPSQRKHGWP